MAGDQTSGKEGLMKILTWNVNCLAPTSRNMVLKHGSVKGFLKHYQADVACFQEVKLPESKLTKELVCVEEFESLWAISRARQGYSGVTTYVSAPYSPVSAAADFLGGGNDEVDKEGRIVEADLKHFVLINAYVPNAGEHPARSRLPFKLRFLELLLEHVEGLVNRGREVVLVGDINIAATRADVHSSYNYDKWYTAEELALMSRLTSVLVDCWRVLHEDATDAFTCWDEKTNARAFNAGCRIDYALVSPRLMPSVVSCEIVDLPPKWSDHAAVLLTLKGVPQIAPHPPCPLTLLYQRRFHDRSQPSIRSMFAPKVPKTVMGVNAAVSVSEGNKTPAKGAETSGQVGILGKAEESKAPGPETAVNTSVSFSQEEQAPVKDAVNTGQVVLLEERGQIEEDQAVEQCEEGGQIGIDENLDGARCSAVQGESMVIEEGEGKAERSTAELGTEPSAGGEVGTSLQIAEDSGNTSVSHNNLATAMVNDGSALRDIVGVSQCKVVVGSPGSQQTGILLAEVEMKPVEDERMPEVTEVTGVTSSVEATGGGQCSHEVENSMRVDGALNQVSEQQGSREVIEIRGVAKGSLQSPNTRKAVKRARQ